MKPGKHSGEYMTLLVDKDGKNATLNFERNTYKMSDAITQKMLKALEPDMKSRGHFIVAYGPLILRSSDVKDLVRILRKACK